MTSINGSFLYCIVKEFTLLNVQDNTKEFPHGNKTNKTGGGPLRDKRVTLKKVLLRDKKAKKIEGH